jgi:serine protease Do
MQHLRKVVSVLLGFIVGFNGISAYAYQIPPAKRLVESEETEFLAKISKAVSTIADRANQAVVFVSISKTVKQPPMGAINPFEFFFGPGAPGMPRGEGSPEQKQQGVGSGFIIDLGKGYIITNNHVIADADEIMVKLGNSETYDAKVVGRDPNTDVAVVQIKDSNFKKSGLGELSLANSDQLAVGDIVIALGAPFGLESSLSFGVVSALGRGSLSITELGDFIQTDAAINPGNSGGPLIDSHGSVIGMNTAIFSRSGAYNGIGFAIPANIVRTVAEQLINNGSMMRGYLGVGLRGGIDAEAAKDLSLPDNTKGALVSGIEPNGPAAKAGFEAGDVIVELNGKVVADDVEVRNRIGLMAPGTKIDVKIYRGGKAKNLSVVLAKWPDRNEVAEQAPAPDKLNAFGLGLAALNSDTRTKYGIRANAGVVVTQVDPDSGADRAGIKAGDLILKVNGNDVRDPKDFTKQINSKRRVYLRIEREGRELFVPLRR